MMSNTKCIVCRDVLGDTGGNYLCRSCMISYRKQNNDMLSIIDWAVKCALRAERKRVKARRKK